MNSKQRYKMEDSHSNRRKFLKLTLIAGAIAALPALFTAKSKKTEKIKLLTPEGKLVEIDKSAIEKEVISTRATNDEVLEWMNSKTKNS